VSLTQLFPCLVSIANSSVVGARREEATTKDPINTVDILHNLKAPTIKVIPTVRITVPKHMASPRSQPPLEAGEPHTAVLSKLLEEECCSRTCRGLQTREAVVEQLHRSAYPM
jgi:hypothetical protein